MYRTLAVLLFLSSALHADELETEVKRFIDAYAILETQAAEIPWWSFTGGGGIVSLRRSP